MGFLNKIEHAFEGSGVEVQVSCPSGIAPGQQTVDVVVSISAKKEPKTVTNVVIALYRIEHRREYTQGQGEHEETFDEEIMSLNSAESVELTPGQAPVQVPFQMPVAGNGLATLGQSGNANGLMKMLGAAAAAEAQLDPAEYELRAHAEVVGATLHPRASQRLFVGAAGGRFGI